MSRNGNAAARKLFRFVTSATCQVEFAPWGKHWWLSRPALTGSKNLLFVRVEMPPGTGHQFHYHPGREEIIYLLDGRAEQWVDRERRVLRPGESAFIPRSTVHGIYNTSKAKATFLAILSPAEASGPFLVDCYRDEPWCGLKEPFEYAKPARR
jgi:quercetin dioxygenase-like cupin family protein